MFNYQMETLVEGLENRLSELESLLLEQNHQIQNLQSKIEELEAKLDKQSEHKQ